MGLVKGCTLVSLTQTSVYTINELNPLPDGCVDVEYTIFMTDFKLVKYIKSRWGSQFVNDISESRYVLILKDGI